MASIDKRKNGTFRIRVSNGMKDGKPVYQSATYKPTPGYTEKEILKQVDEFAIMFENAVRAGKIKPGRKTDNIAIKAMTITLEEFINEYYFDRIEKKLSPNTVPFYRSVAKQFLCPAYGDIRLIDITAEYLQNFVDCLSEPGVRADEANEEPLSGETVKRYSSVFRSIMREAHRMGFIEENKLRNADIDYPKIQKRKLDVYTQEEANWFFEELQNESAKHKAMLLSALFLGLRRAEIVALKWSDIDFEQNCVYVHQSAYKVPKKEQSLKAPKSSAGIRTIFFTDILSDALCEWMSEQENEKEKYKGIWNDQDYIFTGKNGNMMSVDTPSKICSKFEERANLRHLKLHGLRHTCASLMLANGIDIETVKDILGHEDIKTTGIYLHAYDTNRKNAANVLGSMIGKSTSKCV